MASNARETKVAEAIDLVLELSASEFGEFLHAVTIEAGGWDELQKIYTDHMKECEVPEDR